MMMIFFFKNQQIRLRERLRQPWCARYWVLLSPKLQQAIPLLQRCAPLANIVWHMESHRRLCKYQKKKTCATSNRLEERTEYVVMIAGGGGAAAGTARILPPLQPPHYEHVALLSPNCLLEMLTVLFFFFGCCQQQQHMLRTPGWAAPTTYMQHR